MTNLLCFEYAMCDPADLPRFVYATTTGDDVIARYGELVMEAANGGDAVARGIIERAGMELAACVLAVARRLQLTAEAFPVAYVGGAFHAGALLLDPMKREIAHEAPHATVAAPLNTPVEGAAMMAIRAASSPRATRP
jgi:N-acetylglucosamine kinase-like BadF-type ATPase